MSPKRVFALLAIVALVVAVFLWRRGAQAPDAPNDRAEQAAASGPAFELNPRKRSATSALERPRGSISGTVRDDTGRAVAGARVCSWVSSPELSAEDSRDPICSDADANGRYTLANLLPGSFTVVANAPRYAAAYHRGDGDDQQVRLHAGEALTGIDIALLSGAVELKGVVKDIGGGPIGGAWVGVSLEEQWSVGYGLTRSADDGSFALWVLPGKIEVDADADGYSEGRVSAAAPGQFVEVFLTPESVLAGKVVHAGTDDPVARALVQVSGDFRGGGRSSGSAFTDEAGRFRITRLAPGRYKPEAEAVGGYGKAAQSVLLGLGGTRDDVVIELHPAFVVTGQIVANDENRTPCKNGSVALIDRARDATLRAGTQDDGRVEFRAVLPATYEVAVRCNKYTPQDAYPELVVADKDALNQTWMVDAGGAITGTVKAADGSTVALASVRAQLTGGDPRAKRSWGWDQTDDAGEFAMEGLRPGTYLVNAMLSDHPDPVEPAKVTVPAGGSVEIEISLDAGGGVQGTVVDERGTPVANATVRVTSEARWGGWRKNARTADDGTFALEGLRPGAARVVASRGAFWGNALRKPGASDDDTPGERVTIEANAVASVQLVVESQDGVIRGRVVDESGKPVSDAFIDRQRESDRAGARTASAARFVRWSWGRKPELTDTDGRFQLEELTPGAYTVRAYRRGGGEAIAEGVAVGSNVELTIRSTGKVTGTVAGAGGKPPEQFTVQLQDDTGFFRSEQFFRTGGRWELTEVPGGSYTVSAAAGDGTATDEVTLAEGETRDGIALVLESRASVVGRLVDEDTGDPVPGFRLHIRPVEGAGASQWRMQGEADRNAVSDASGNFSVERAPAGKVNIMAMPENWEDAEYGFGRAVRTLEPGKRNDIGDIPMQRRRLGPRQRAGDLGFTFKEQSPDTEPENWRLEVALVRPDGPAADSGLEVGDVIVSVDGKDVRGANVSRFWTSSRVPEGTTLEFGTERGETVEVTAGKPL